MNPTLPYVVKLGLDSGANALVVTEESTVSVCGVVPPAAVKPVVVVANVSPLTVEGVIAPKVKVMAGVVVAFATVPDMPLAVVTETLVTVPEPPPASVVHANPLAVV